jgi:drug/metabolite transporter (DMT)-like permease
VIAALLIPFCTFAWPPPILPVQWLSLIMLGVVNTALMLQLYLYALRRLTPSTCSGFVALEPVYAILFAAQLFHEPITWWIVVSAALIVAASLILMKSERAETLAK